MSDSHTVAQARAKELIDQIELIWLNDPQWKCHLCGKTALCKHHQLLAAAKQLADLLSSISAEQGHPQSAAVVRAASIDRARQA